MPPSTTSRRDSLSAASEALQGHHVGWHPERPPAEDGDAVDREGERTSVPVDLNGPESDRTQVHVEAVDRQVHGVERLRAVGVGPPSFRVGYPDDTVDDAVAVHIGNGGRLTMVPDAQLDLGPGVDPRELHSNADRSARSVTGCDHVTLGDERP